MGRTASSFFLSGDGAYSSTLKMEAVRSCETSVDFRRTAWRYVSEDSARRPFLIRVIGRTFTDICFNSSSSAAVYTALVLTFCTYSVFYL
jgi:hypothetical protein